MNRYSKIYLPLVAAILVLSAGSFTTARADEAPPSDGQILPDEEELRALGDMAQRMMREFAGRVEPMVERLKSLVDDLDAYESPEMLPNGDIIIRRKPDADPVPPPEEDGGITL